MSAVIIDSLVGGVLYVVTLAVLLIVGASATALGLPSALTLLVVLLLILAVSLVEVIHHVRGVGRRGATIGKRCVGIVVVDEVDGGPIGVNRALSRALVLGLQSVPLGLGNLSILLDHGTRGQGWHDKVAHTVVIRAEGRAFGVAVGEALGDLRRA